MPAEDLRLVSIVRLNAADKARQKAFEERDLAQRQVRDQQAQIERLKAELAAIASAGRRRA